MGIEVKLDKFEGPLDLLLHLIKENEIDIYDIPIAQITDQYLAYLEEMKKLDLVIAGEFMVMAAILIHIKSKMLLPIDENEELDEEGDPRSELVRKLLEYQSYKEAAMELGEMEHERSKVFTRNLSDYYFKEQEKQSGHIGESFNATLFDLIKAFSRVIKEMRPMESFHEVYEEVISIEERIDQMKIVIGSKKRLRFRDLFGPKMTKNELIVTFLAMLELMRSRLIGVEQGTMFDDIFIYWKDDTGKPQELAQNG